MLLTELKGRYWTKESWNEWDVKRQLFDFLTQWDLQAVVYLSIAALVVRFIFLHHPSCVVFDEVHFGGFTRHYLKHEYFFDLHPPLARLLVTLSAWAGSFDGQFAFYAIGADYIRGKAPYVVMRAFTAFFGAMVAPIAFVTLRGFNLSSHLSAAIAACVIFENALMTQSRLILLDSYLVFFTTLTGLFWSLFLRLRKQPFTPGWKLSLLGVGASMALAASCKWVGLFLVAGIGIFAIAELWAIFGDVSKPLHFVHRTIYLIIVPFLIYAFTFWIHFTLLSNYSAAAAGHSIEFQQSLSGGESKATYRDVYLGSMVRLRQIRSEGGLLHSHPHNYPGGSKQQQITSYPHRDGNNMWLVRRALVEGVSYGAGDRPEEEEMVRLRHGDEIRLEHQQTGRFLHSHGIDPPLSSREHHNEVSGYGHHKSRFSDRNDNWIIEIVDSNGDPIEVAEGIEPPMIEAINTRFRLIHSLRGWDKG